MQGGYQNQYLPQIMAGMKLAAFHLGDGAAINRTPADRWNRARKKRKVVLKYDISLYQTRSALNTDSSPKVELKHRHGCGEKVPAIHMD